MQKKNPFFDRGLPQKGRKADGVMDMGIKSGAARETLKAEYLPWGQAGGIYPKPRLAQAYVIWQNYGPLFSPAEALEKGTLFPELYSPYPY